MANTYYDLLHYHIMYLLQYIEFSLQNRFSKKKFNTNSFEPTVYYLIKYIY